MSMLFTDSHNDLPEGLNRRARELLTERSHSGLLREAARVPQKISISFSSNDYFGLSQDRRVCDAAAAAIHRYGAGSGGSRILHMRHSFHDEIAIALSDHIPSGWKAVYANSGTAANSVFFDMFSKVSPGAEIFLDHLAHSSLVSAAKSTGLPVRFFRHNDWSGLENRLRKCSAASKLIVLEALHSMEGDFLNFKAISEVCKSVEGCGLYIDAAHSAGLLGISGGCFQNSIFPLIRSYLVGTMLGCGKAFGVSGGILALPEFLAQLCYQHGRQIIYTTDAAPATLAALSCSLRILNTEGNHYAQKLSREVAIFADQLLSRSAEQSLPLRIHLRNNNPDTTPSTFKSETPPQECFHIFFHQEETTKIMSPILTILHTRTELLHEMKQFLLTQGINIPFIRSPSVPRGRERLRITVCLINDHGRDDSNPHLQSLTQLSNALISFLRRQI